MNRLFFVIGLAFGFGLFEFLYYFILNYVYLKNIDLYLVLFVNKKNQENLKKYFKELKD